MKNTCNQLCDSKGNPVEKQEISTQKNLTNSLDRFEKLFGFRPNTIPLIINSKKLKPWEAATTWIEEKNGQRSCFIQLKSLKPPRLYSLEEIISHELVHAVRSHLDEPLFEEILAFQTSTSAYRRFFGPLFSQPLEATLFCASLLISWAGSMISLFLEIRELLWICWALPILMLIPLLWRLWQHQTLFKKAYLFLEAQGHNPLSTLLYSTDAQIKAYARGLVQSPGPLDT